MAYHKLDGARVLVKNTLSSKGKYGKYRGKVGIIKSQYHRTFNSDIEVEFEEEGLPILVNASLDALIVLDHSRDNDKEDLVKRKAILEKELAHINNILGYMQIIPDLGDKEIKAIEILKMLNKDVSISNVKLIASNL